MHPTDFIKRTSHRLYLTLVAHYTKDQETDAPSKKRKKRDDEPIPQFLGTPLKNESDVARAIWRGRLQMKGEYIDGV